MYSETVFFLLLVSVEVFSQISVHVYEGEECTVSNGVMGICRMQFGCARTRTSKNEEKPKPLKRCGFKGLIELKCCPQSMKLAENACRRIRDEVPPKSSPTISGGRDAEAGEFPHMAALWYPSKKNEGENLTPWKCAGSLISSYFVLTAAHCIIDELPTKFRMGDLDLQSAKDDEHAETFDIAEIIRHPKYNPAKSRYFDIGLVKSKEKISFNYYIYPACLHTKGDVSSFDYSIVGWGAMDLNVMSRLHITQTLKEATVEGMTNKMCNGFYNNSAVNDKYKRGIIDHLICARSPAGQKSNTCEGDSGGPLQYVNGDIYYITGVTSYGMTCGDQQPGIYTRVRKFAPWIETMVWGREDNRVRRKPRK